jgi:hypothetical protein
LLDSPPLSPMILEHPASSSLLPQQTVSIKGDAAYLNSAGKYCRQFSASGPFPARSGGGNATLLDVVTEPQLTGVASWDSRPDSPYWQDVKMHMCTLGSLVIHASPSCCTTLSSFSVPMPAMRHMPQTWKRDASPEYPSFVFL